MSGTLRYFRGDERPAWQETITVNGVADNYSSGFTFAVKVQLGSATPVLTKTTGITGAASGVITVAWAENDLDVTPGVYRALLVVTRTSDSLELTVERTLEVLAA
jgi:hypothetical protein